MSAAPVEDAAIRDAVQKELDRIAARRVAGLNARTAIAGAAIALISGLLSGYVSATLTASTARTEQIRQERREVYADFLLSLGKFDEVLYVLNNTSATPLAKAKMASDWQSALNEIYVKRNAIYLISSRGMIDATNSLDDAYTRLGQKFPNTAAVANNTGTLRIPKKNFLDAARTDIGTMTQE